MQIMNPRRPEEVNLSDEGQNWAKSEKTQQKKMAWLFLSPLERRREIDLMMNGDVSDLKLQIGSYYYWIRRIQNIPELCRLAVRRDSFILYEVLQHDNLGISDDDLEDAVRQADGELCPGQEFRISNHIKRKLQILYAP
jgi:hypothetical protein